MKYLLTSMALAIFVLPVMFGSGAFSNDGGGHYTNLNNPDVRFDWANQHIAVPGMGGQHANDNAAVVPHGSATLVVPKSN